MIIATKNIDYAALKAEAKGQIDAMSGEARARFITVSAGQEYVYLAKFEQAKSYLSDPEGSYPFLTAEASATGQSVADAAAAIVAAKSVSDTQLAGVEGVRLAAKRDVDAAANKASVINEIVAQAEADLAAL